MIITDEAFPFLVAQRGRLDRLKHDRAIWERAYRNELLDEFIAIEQFLPLEVHSILDIGGGMGGIDALFVHHYGADTEVAILDGEDDRPSARCHSKTFSNMRIAKDFLAINGVLNFTPIPATTLMDPRPFDLIVSFASWCFHYPPEAYLNWVASCRGPKTKMIIDLRMKNRGWRSVMEDCFGPAIPIGVNQNAKAVRLLF